MNLLTAIPLMLPDGQPAARVDVALATIDIASLVVTIKVIGYDADGNARRIEEVLHQLTALREIPADELVQIAEAHFSQDNKDEQ